MSELKFLDQLTNCFEKLPSVGKKTASRYAYSIIEKMNEEDVINFANILIETKKNVHHCSICGMLTNTDVCEICSDNERDCSKIIVVKDTKDVFAIEKTKQYNGLYHVLGGLISPLDGIGPDKLNIESLEKRCKSNGITELIFATSFTPNGETTALFLERILSRDGLVISRIGYGIPAGGDIEYIDELTLKRAIEGRNILR